MDKLDKLLDFLELYELEEIQRRIDEIPANKEMAEKMSRDEMAFNIVLTLAWWYKEIDNDFPKGVDPAQRREEIWAKAKELDIKAE